MIPLPWRTRRRDVPPVVVAAPAQPPAPPAPRPPIRVNPPAQPTPPRMPDESATRYREPYPWQVGAVGVLWLRDEAAVLALLADHGGDLHAHLTVHLEDR